MRRARRISTNLRVADIAAATGFWLDYLGLSEEEFNLGWVARLTNPETGAHVQLVTEDATAPAFADLSVHVGDVEEAYAAARAGGYEILHPLTQEEWGVRRFFVRAPDGTVVNVVQHHE